jgi:RNA polymerase sigma factor (sigma-70 family)
MAAIDDHDLLRRFTLDRSEEAFAELVRRNINLVYGTAVRHVNGDAALAEDVTQEVFADLARKAERLLERPALKGWLYTSTRFAAAKVRRSEVRRRVRETEAHAMHEIDRTEESTAGVKWEKVRPLIDDALETLGEDDREAVLMRFFEGRAFGELGATLHLTEEAARKRVERALDRLAEVLQKRGIASTGAALALALGSQAAVELPGRLVLEITRSVLPPRPALSSWRTMVIPALAAALVVALASLIVAQRRGNEALRGEIVQREQVRAAIIRLQRENQAMVREAAEVEMLRRDDAELAKLRQDLAALRRQMERATKTAQPHAVVSGKVGLPGRRALPAGGMLLRELIERDGGVTFEADTSAIKVTRTLPDKSVKVFSLDWQKSGASFIVEPGDVVYVPERSVKIPRTAVVVSGSVRKPGLVEVPLGGLMIAEVLSRAGGTTENANLAAVRVTRSGLNNGVDVIRIPWGAPIPVEPGDVVYVPEKSP